MSFFFRVLYSQADKFNPLLYAQIKDRLFLTDEGRPHNEGQSPPYYRLYLTRQFTQIVFQPGHLDIVQ